MSTRFKKSSPRHLNRRAFLYGLGGVSVGLPFLESAPERSAWAQTEEPVFVLFMGTANGIIVDEFWPTALGPLTGLEAELNATGLLADFEEQLLFIRGLRYPANVTRETHGQAYPQMLTGAPYGANITSALASATAASLDVILAPLLNHDGADPLTLYSGMKQGYLDEAMSWTAEGTVREAEGNPFVVYSSLVSAVAGNQDPGVLADAVLVRRQSAIDLAREELLTFRGRENISKNDDARLEQHLTALRSIEQSLGELAGSVCSTDLLDVTGITAAAETYRQNGMVEAVSKLQLELTAFAFACNLNHVATLQSGDGLDQTRYDVPSNERGWSFHHISHQIQNDGAAGMDAVAVQAHAEVDRVRMETLAHGIRQFDAHQLLDKSLIMWTNQFSNGTAGSFVDLPFILSGNPYGRLRSGQYVSFNNQLNGELLTTIAQVLGVDRLIGTAHQGLDVLLT
jgi:hypothetical protein